jgi:hypothetical protein
VWKYELALDVEKRSGRPIVKHEYVSIGGVEKFASNAVSPRVVDTQRQYQTAVEQSALNGPFRPLVDLFRSIEYVSLVPQLIREGQASPGLSPGRDPLGRDLLDRIARTKSTTRKKYLAFISRAVKRVVPQLSSIEFFQDRTGRPHIQAKFMHWRGPAAKQWENQLSDGTLRLIAMLWQLQCPGGPILLDEPEWSLHDRILRQLPTFFHRAQEHSGGRQIIVSTHSQSVLDDESIGVKEVLLVMPAKAEGSMLVPAETMKTVRRLMEAGVPASEAALPETARTLKQLSLDFVKGAD